MKFLFDQNISHRILKRIPEKYIDSSTVKIMNDNNYGCFEIFRLQTK